MSKYNNKIVEYEGEKFHSLSELARWKELQLLEKAGKIMVLERQVPYILSPSVVINGRKRPAMKYIADYVYFEDYKVIVEDRKGVLTPEYKLKRHLMKAVHGIDIFETKGK